MEFEILNLNIEAGIAVVTISRPKALNALNTQFFNEMDSMVEKINGMPEVKVMVITGEGKAFVAGADIAEMVDKTQKEGSEFSRLGQNTFRSLEKMDIPVIAAINGFALGEGLNWQWVAISGLPAPKPNSGNPK